MMTSNQLRGLIDRLGQTQIGLAALLGVHDVTMRRWCRYGVDGLPAIVLKLLANGKIKLRDIEVCRD